MTHLKYSSENSSGANSPSSVFIIEHKEMFGVVILHCIYAPAHSAEKRSVKVVTLPFSIFNSGTLYKIVFIKF